MSNNKGRVYTETMDYSEDVPGPLVAAWYAPTISWVPQEDVVLVALVIAGQIGEYTTALAAAGAESILIRGQVGVNATPDKAGVIAPFILQCAITQQGAVTPAPVRIGDQLNLFVLCDGIQLKQDAALCLHVNRMSSLAAACGAHVHVAIQFRKK